MKSLLPSSWLAVAKMDRPRPSSARLTGIAHVFGRESDGIAKVVGKDLPRWQREGLESERKQIAVIATPQGPAWVLRPRPRAKSVSHGGLLEDSAYAEYRDGAGAVVAHARAAGIAALVVDFHECSPEQRQGFLTGLELAGYAFRNEREGKSATRPTLILRQDGQALSRDELQAAMARGRAVNMARHLVNLPPNELHPLSYAKHVRSAVSGTGLRVEIWDAARLKKERMGLHLAVGRGAEHGPCLVRLSWRPPRRSGVKAPPRGPVAFVGKGITFDSGGLDIKPSSGMRLMKKDMGGAAAVTALAWWAATSKYPAPLDFYLALAENAVDSRSFRPGDLITARGGQVVEIDNTDAEGRLVLADALDVAVTRTGADAPEVVVDVATLTGAIKVALGAEIAGLFSNDDVLAEAIAGAGQRAGDLNWRMPLADRYWGSLSSPFADFKNSADGFGGAVTAALFLSRFVRGKSWAHLDIYAWADKANGALLSSGGSGQAVQCLVQWLEDRI